MEAKVGLLVGTVSADEVMIAGDTGGVQLRTGRDTARKESAIEWERRI